METKSFRLKITIILQKDNQKVYMRPSPRRMQNFLRNKAEFYLKKGFSITVRVTYGKMTDVFGKTIFSQNSGTYERLDDLKWAYQTFVKEYV